nr:immunoglobulin light chain junction region [Macaca mulatta]
VYYCSSYAGSHTVLF